MWIVVGILTALSASLAIVVAVLAMREPQSAPPTTDAASSATLASGPALLAAEDAGSADAAVEASAKPPPLTPEQLDELSGDYTCRLDDTASFPCRIANGKLEKLAGSQRFKGPVKKLGNGNIEFSGTFFCPFGDCTHPVATTFVRQAPGRYVGRFAPTNAPGAGGGGERVTLAKVR